MDPDKPPTGRSRAVAIPGPLGFGAAPLGNLFARVDEADAAACLTVAWDVGVRYYDTAPLYGAGLSERRIGAALRGRPRAEFLLSTKVGRLLVPDPSVPEEQNSYVGGLSHRVLFDYSADGATRSIEESLARLGLDRIDVAYIHDVGEDAHGPAWEAMFAQAMAGAARALSALRDKGVIRAWGLGVNRIAPCVRALEESDPDLFLLAGRYTLLDAAPALEELFPRCAAAGVRLVLGGPYNSGVLAGGTTFDYVPAAPEVQDRVRRLAAACEAHGVSLKAAALQFCAAPPVVAAVIAGARTAAEVGENAALMQAPIPAALWQTLKRDGLLPEGAPEPPARDAQPASDAPAR